MGVIFRSSINFCTGQPRRQPRGSSQLHERSALVPDTALQLYRVLIDQFTPLNKNTFKITTWSTSTCSKQKKRDFKNSVLTISFHVFLNRTRLALNESWNLGTPWTPFKANFTAANKHEPFLRDVFNFFFFSELCIFSSYLTWLGLKISWNYGTPWSPLISRFPMKKKIWGNKPRQAYTHTQTVTRTTRASSWIQEVSLSLSLFLVPLHVVAVEKRFPEMTWHSFRLQQLYTKELSSPYGEDPHLFNIMQPFTFSRMWRVRNVWGERKEKRTSNHFYICWKWNESRVIGYPDDRQGDGFWWRGVRAHSSAKLSE